MRPVKTLPLISLTALFFALPFFGGLGLAAETSLDGVLRDADGHPLAGKTLTLQDGQGAEVAKSTSDAAGHYTFADVPVDIYVLQAMEGDKIIASTAVNLPKRGTAYRDLTVRPDAPLTIVMSQGKPQTRDEVTVQSGANAYKTDSQAINALPAGDNTSFDKVLEQSPGVVQDSFGQTHIRGEHADLQYRLNGIILPESISGFGQTIDPRLIESTTLLDGALPAQYGYRTAGIVDIQTKTGFDSGGVAEMFGGSHNTLEPSISYGGTTQDGADYFFTASHLSSDLGIENPTPAKDAIHDHTDQDKQFGYGSYQISPDQRVELFAGDSLGHFQIPNSPNQTPNYTVNGVSTFDSSQLNERQFESNQYTAAAWQGQNGPYQLQIAPYLRNSETHFQPDGLGDLVFNGVSSNVRQTDLATGVQTDGSWRADADHTLRAGFMIQNDSASTDTNTQVLPGAPGAQTSDIPMTIIDNHNKDGQFYGFYAQDEWRWTPQLTINYGGRFDLNDAYLTEYQFSPRLNVVYKPDEATTLHAGYARYFTPPELELVQPTSITKFAGTTNAPAVTEDGAVKAERSHNFDIGATHNLTHQIEVGIDGYYKLVHNLLDEGQFGQALIYTPFNYEHGQIYGAELTASYTSEKFKAYGNFAASRAVGENIVSSQFNFTDPAELAYIQDHYVHLDHDQTFTASGGISYLFMPETTAGLTGIYGSGLRSGFANTDKLPSYTQFDASMTRDFDLIAGKRTSLRLTVINLFDTVYELRDGSGIGVGAPQYGPRRGFFAGLSQEF